MKLLVVIANYKVAHLTIDCLRSLAEEVPQVPGTHVAVCENGTGDDSAQRIQRAIDEQQWTAWCTLTAVHPNLGFTGGNNIILRPALQSFDPPQYVLLLNADTVVHPNSIRRLTDFMDSNPQIGIAGSRLEYPDGEPQRSAFRFPSAASEFESSIRSRIVNRFLKRWVVAPPVPANACETDWVGGACMIIRREVFDAIGLLDEGYYTHYEDVDFCFNARKAGWPVWYVPDSRITHFVGQSTGLTVKKPKRLPPYYFGARRRYFLKNYGLVHAALADFGLILGHTIGSLRVLFGKQIDTPPFFLYDTIRQSVFFTGFRLKDVQNPALTSLGTPDFAKHGSPEKNNIAKEPGAT
jgi:N-acetylglucosaminyl-diphospho-decaprenol L-rhamnosyltransferase